MKRNWETMRIILEKVEAVELLVYLEKEKYLDSGMSEEDVLGHIEIMLDAGILQNGKIPRGWAGKYSQYDVQGVFISMAGHDLLDALRDQNVWLRIRNKARQAAVSLSWEFIKAAMPVVMRELLNK